MDESAAKRGGRWRFRWPALLGGAIAAIPLVPIVIGAVAISAPGGSAGSKFVPVRSRARSAARSFQPQIPVGQGALVALVLHRTKMLIEPGGRVLASVPPHTEFGSPQALLVVRQAAGWLGVVSALAGNGRVGWIPRSATTLNRVPWKLKVSLSARLLTVIDRGKVVKRYTVAIGQPAAPTPTGRFAVTDRLATGDPAGPYGCCILALSAHSPHAIQGWTGGDRIAIHSTPDTASIGEAASHGCLRLTLDEGRWLMHHIPLGTPTVISS